jgi:LemA protein
MSNGLAYAIPGALLLILLVLYNGLVRLRNRVRAAWAQIDVQLRRRHDLIPNLVASVRAYMQHERGIFDAITKARESAARAGGDPQARAAAEDALSRALRPLFALVESTPELKASQTMLSFQEELSSTESRIAFAQQHYNDTVMEYNTAIESVPSVFVARLFGFRPETPYAAAEAEKAPVQVDFDKAV